MNNPDNKPRASSVTYSLLISESVYRLVVVVERVIRWFIKSVIRPCMFIVWCLRL
ncbi:MAG: hypothetical protein GWP56_09020 [Gammaproteobacteria bacterium]|nr:hypothetical protein [Gammaproteobacteria bacterium]